MKRHKRIKKTHTTQPATFEEAVDVVFAELKEIMLKKQKDYGPRNILDFAELGVLVRVNDKVQRLRNLLMNNKKAQNESIEDSWKDLANYAAIALMLKKGIFELPLKDERHH